MLSVNSKYIPVSEDLQEPICCPNCQGILHSMSASALKCKSCASTFPVINGIPRFVPADNYTASFGFQWNIHAKTQIDKFNGLTVSRDRFFNQSRWTEEELRGKTVLECG